MYSCKLGASRPKNSTSQQKGKLGATSLDWLLKKSGEKPQEIRRNVEVCFHLFYACEELQITNQNEA